MQRILLVDGRRVAPGEPAVAGDDPGLLGQGVYESLRTYEREPFAVARHLARLAAGLERLGIEVDPALVEEDLREAAAAGAAALPGELTLRVLVTARGTRIVEALPLIVRSPTVRAVTLPWPRAHGGPLVGVKAASTAATLVARRHVAAQGADDGIWLTEEGNVAEALAANVFAVLGGRLVTPPLTDGALAGVTRSFHLELGAVEHSLTREELAGATEAFLSATSLPARALVELDGRAIGGGRAGPVTGELAATFADRARAIVRRPAG
jgi:branched-chain amino acid aminotransferase